MNPERSYRTLIVDDNAAIHADFRKILGSDTSKRKLDVKEAVLFGSPAIAVPRAHFILSFVSQGQEALELMKVTCLAGDRFSLVFMDMRMPPGWDGIETAGKLWEVDPDLKPRTL